MSFKQGFLGCFGNIPVCAISYFVPCYTYGKVAESVGEDFLKTCICTMCPCRPCFHYKVRGAVRAKYGIQGDEKTDCLLHCCLPVCTIAQEANEVQQQGHAPPGTIILSRD